MKIGFISLGCAKNLVDSENIIGIFDDPFFNYESNPKECDAIIVNTCGFIESAKEESINTILETAELKKDKLKYLIVTGCLSARYHDELIKELPEVDLFVKIEEYPNLHNTLSKLFNHEINTAYGKNRKLVTNNYCAYLKIGDGCDNRCAYCAIPLIRGRYHSYPLIDLINEAKQLYVEGVKELNIVAQDTTIYGCDINSSLSELLVELDKIDFTWIRVLYMYPADINEELLDTIKNSKHILPYFDIPIQYGNNDLLKLMNRRGTREDIYRIIKMIRGKFANPIIRTTLIVGFPYETDDTFNDTLELVNDLKFDSMGAFTYSREEDTLAYNMPQVDEKLATDRYNKLMALQQSIVFEKNKNRIGKTFTCLIERHEELFNRYIARSYMSAPDGVDGVVYIYTDKELKIGDFVEAKITDYKDYDLIAEIA